MNNKKYKRTVGIVVGLTLLAGGLFVYDNIYITAKQREDLVPVYLAKTDIPAYTTVTENMFSVVGINKDSLLPSYVIDISQVIGNETVGTILKDEPLTKQRVGTTGGMGEQGEFLLKIEPDFVSDISKNDFIKVYVQLVDQRTNETAIKVLFDEKKVRKVSSPDNVAIETELQTGVKIGSVYVNVNEQELQDYYNAKQTGYIIVAKYDSVDVGKVQATQEIVEKTEKEVGKYETNSQEALNSQRPLKEETNEGSAVMSYVVQEGEDIETLSIKFKTSVDELSIMNEQKMEFVVGETITVPAE